MDSNEGRRSKVPAGTFRASSHPPPVSAGEKTGATPPPPPPDAVSARPPKPPAQSAAPKKRERVGTLSGRPPQIELPTEIDGRAKFTSTLVGVTPSQAPPPPAAGPVLAPPPWRGASAYQSGEEPQPRVSSISSPGTAPGVLPDGTVAHPDDRRVPHTRITAGAPPAPTPDGDEPAQATAAIGDAIQQLLDAQTSVSMEGVQEGQPARPASSASSAVGEDGFLRDSALEPVRESQIEVLRDSAIEEELPAEPVRSLPPAAPVARRAGEGEAKERVRVEPSAVPEPRAAAPSARWAAPPTPVAAPPERASQPDRELASYSFVEPKSGQDASVAPAERAQPSEADGANVRLGLWVAAAIVLVGAGGWLATRGGFVKPPRTPASAGPVIAAPPPSAQGTAPKPEPQPEPAGPELGDVAPAEPAAEPAASAQPNEAAPAEQEPSEPPAATRAVRAPKWPAAAEKAAPAVAAPSAPSPVLSVTPREASPEAPPAANETKEPAPEGPLPETPSRENVQSALDAKRPEVLACAAGQHGVAEVDLTVASSGAVTHAVVGGDFAGSPAGSCIARVVRTAQFAPFSKPRFRVIYPFSL